MPLLFTHAEHQTRAMLLGMIYDWRDCTYISLEGTLNYFDAETLQPMNYEQCMGRMRQWETGHMTQDHLPEPTPYCRE